MDKIEILLLGLIGIIIILLLISQTEEWQSTSSDGEMSTIQQDGNQRMPAGGIPGLMPGPGGGP